MAQQQTLGTEFYLFTDGTGAPAPHLIISSHGAYISRPETGKRSQGQEGDGFFQVPAGRHLFFYSPHKRSLQDPTVTLLLGLDPVETKAAGELVRNYRLKKYQGRHGSRTETYDSIMADIDRNRNLAQIQEDTLRGLGLDLAIPMDTDQRRLAYEALLPTLSAADQNQLTAAFGSQRVERYDVLTIRSRNIDVRSTLGLGVTLKEVLAAIPAGYQNIHCAFCRSSVFDFFSKAYTAPRGTDWDRRANGSRRPLRERERETVLEVVLV